MGKGWSKGLTKDTDPSVRKISETMKRRKIDNFAHWRKLAKQSGIIPKSYPALKKNGDLAELMGVVLGDGHISQFPRTEELTLFSNSNNKGFVERYSSLVEKIFNKKPYVAKVSSCNCIRIRIYEKYISRRLGVPLSPRGKKTIRIPPWIFKSRPYMLRYLRGLYEAEGSHCVHLPTSTYKFFFSNKNTSMLANVFRLMKKLGFHPHMSKRNDSVQVSRKEEVLSAIKLLKFRMY